MFEAHPTWANKKAYADLKDYAEAEIATIDGVEDGGEEYYDEEDGNEDEEEKVEEEKK